MRVGGRQQRARRGVVGSFFIGLLVLGLGATSEAQQPQARQQKRPRHETNATRQARIARTVEQTYSHPLEIIGGGGYLRWKSGPYTKKNNEVSWAVDANYYLTPKFAIVGATQGSFGHAYQQLPLQFPQIARPQINEYFFTGGAGYRFYEKEKVAMSVQGTGGVAWGIFSGGAKGLTGPQVGLWEDGFRPAFTVKYNVDYNFYPNLAVRISPTYVGTTFGSSLQNNLGFNVGVVYRFGHQR